MLETASNLIIIPILVCMFVGIDRDKWISWNKINEFFSL